MATKRYANQIIVVRRGEPEKDQTHPYTKLSNEAKKYAAQHLGHYGYKLWSFMPELVIDNEEWAFSPSYFAQNWGGNEKSWRDARDELKEKGFLIQIDGNKYEFIENPGEVSIEGEVWSYEVAADQVEQWIADDVARMRDGRIVKVKSF